MNCQDNSSLLVVARGVSYSMMKGGNFKSIQYCLRRSIVKLRLKKFSINIHSIHPYP
jgi:hypothetical protein